MACVSTGPVSNPLVNVSRQIDIVTAKFFNNGLKPCVVLIRGFSLNESQNPAITQVVNIKPKKEVERAYSVNTDAFQFNFETFNCTNVKISVWGRKDALSEEIPVIYIG